MSKRPRLTYANVAATLSLFIAFGGASYAAIKLPKNSVGARQLKKNSVTTAKIKKNAVTAAKIGSGAVNAAKVQDGSLTGADIQEGSLTGADINQASLNDVPAGNVTTMSFSADESCSPSLPPPSGVSSSRPAPGVCLITFPGSVANCTASVTVRFRLGNALLKAAERTAQAITKTGEPNFIVVATYQEGSLIGLPFDLILVC